MKKQGRYLRVYGCLFAIPHHTYRAASRGRGTYIFDVRTLYSVRDTDTYDTYHPYKCTNYSYHHPGPLPPFHFQTCLGNREFSDIIVVMSSITPTPQGKLSYVRMYLYVGLSTYIRHLYIRNKERTIHRGYMYCMYSTNTQRRWGVSYQQSASAAPLGGCLRALLSFIILLPRA